MTQLLAMPHRQQHLVKIQAVSEKWCKNCIFKCKQLVLEKVPFNHHCMQYISCFSQPFWCKSIIYRKWNGDWPFGNTVSHSYHKPYCNSLPYTLLIHTYFKYDFIGFLTDVWVTFNLKFKSVGEPGKLSLRSSPTNPAWLWVTN